MSPCLPLMGKTKYDCFQPLISSLTPSQSSSVSNKILTVRRSELRENSGGDLNGGGHGPQGLVFTSSHYVYGKDNIEHCFGADSSCLLATGKGNIQGEARDLHRVSHVGQGSKPILTVSIVLLIIVSAFLRENNKMQLFSHKLSGLESRCRSDCV